MTRTWLRAGLVFLALTQVTVGAWILLLPREFYNNPWVNIHSESEPAGATRR